MTLIRVSDAVLPWVLPAAAVAASQDLEYLRTGFGWLAIGTFGGFLRVLFLFARQRRPTFWLIALTMAAAPAMGFMAGMIAMAYQLEPGPRLLSVLGAGMFAEMIISIGDSALNAAKKKPLEFLGKGRWREILATLLGLNKDKP